MYEYENCIFILKIKLVFSKILKIKPIGLKNGFRPIDLILTRNY